MFNMFRLMRCSSWSLPGYSFSLKTFVTKNQPFNRYTTKAPEPKFQSKSELGEIIYRNENQSRFYRLAVSFGLVQFLCITNFSYFGLQTIKEEIDENKKLVIPVLSYNIEVYEAKFKRRCIACALIMSMGLLHCINMYTLRAVKVLALLKDKTIAVVTYSPFSRHRILRVPIEHVSGVRGRTAGLKYIQLKVKGKKLNYMVDMTQGKFDNLRRFDTEINVKREFK